MQRVNEIRFDQEYSRIFARFDDAWQAYYLKDIQWIRNFGGFVHVQHTDTSLLIMHTHWMEEVTSLSPLVQVNNSDWLNGKYVTEIHAQYVKIGANFFACNSQEILNRLKAIHLQKNDE